MEREHGQQHVPLPSHNQQDEHLSNHDQEDEFQHPQLPQRLEQNNQQQPVDLSRDYQLPTHQELPLPPNTAHNVRLFVGRQFPPQVEVFSIGHMTEQCQFCQAFRFPMEPLNCCHNGKVSLPPLSPYPQELKNLLTQNNAQSRNFKENIRQYNSAVAFASFGANILPHRRGGPYSFRIHGQIYHQTGPLHPPENNNPCYSQLYIIEGDLAVETRMSQNENQFCRRDTMILLDIILQRVNPYAAAYRHMHEVEQAQIQTAEEEGLAPQQVTMYLKRGNDKRRYNEPRHDEVAAIFIGNDGAPPPERDIVVYPKDHTTRNISYRSANADPMVYPILFPCGDQGWYPGMDHTGDNRTAHINKVSLLQFYSFRLAARQAFSPLFYGGKLFQQYIVDAYVRTEASRLDYIRSNQKGLRVEMYQGLMDHINSQAEERNLQPGKIVILPSSFKGSPRAMQQNFQDAMAMVAKFGKPDLFLTFTCNPRCADITNSLPQGQRPEHRPTLLQESLICNYRNY